MVSFVSFLDNDSFKYFRFKNQERNLEKAIFNNLYFKKKALRITATYRFASAQGLARPAANSLSGIRLAYASYMPVPNVPFRDSGSGNFGKSSSLYVMTQCMPQDMGNTFDIEK